MLTEAQPSNCSTTSDQVALDALAQRHAPLSVVPAAVPNIAGKSCLSSMRGKHGKPSRPGLRIMFLKFSLWRMTELARIVYIDSDAMVLRPLRSLWNLELAPHFYAAELGYLVIS